MLEEIPAELLTVVVPSVIGIGAVALTVLLVFWLGSGRQHSFEEAKALASKKAEEALKEHQSPRTKKKKAFPKKKKDEHLEDSQSSKEPPKSILKQGGGKSETPDRRVEFNLKTPPKESSNPRAHPPTPHPSAGKQPRLEVSSSSKMSTKPESPAEREEDPKPKPTSTQKPAPQLPTSSPSLKKPTQGGQKKPRHKPKQLSFEPAEALSMSHISEILGTSSLSDEEIQQLIEQLFEKMNANAEWEAISQANMRSESVKSLKKLVQDLQSRCNEAETTVVAHSNKIKELRAEIQQERGRHQLSENNLQARITQQLNEMHVAKTKISGLEDELKQTKALSTPHALQQLKEEHSTLQHQMHTIAQQNSSLNSQLVGATKQAQDLQENNAALKSELRRAKDALKSPTDMRQLADKIAELEGIVGSLESENQQLKADMQALNDKKVRKFTDVEALSSVQAERDTLAQKLGATEEQLQEAEGEIQGLNEQVEALGSKNSVTQGRVAKLEAENISLQSEINSLKQKEREVPVQAHELKAQLQPTHALRAELDAKRVEEVSQMQAQYELEMNSRQSQHVAELQGLQDTIAWLEGAKEEHEREMGDLRSQLKGQEEKISQVSEQLVSEQSSKKELQSELESLKGAPGINGPPQENGVKEEELAQKTEEVSRIQQERDEFAEQLKALEEKLSDLKVKNNTLRDNCWKARDDAATAEKKCEERLKQAYKDAEKRCKAVKIETIAEAQEVQRSLLQRLFSEVSVEATSFSAWVDEFETKALDSLEQTRSEISDLRSRVDELQQNEHKSIQEAEQFRQTLHTTMEILSRLQSEVDDHNTKYQQMIDERDQMVERERTTNKNLQEQLRKEKETTAKLQKELQSTKEKSDSENNREKLKELELRLQDAEHHREIYEAESETLRHSLHHELELKETSEQQMEEMTEKMKDLEERVKAEGQQKDELSQKNEEMSREAGELQDKLREAEEKLEMMKSSNRELNAKIVSLSPQISATSSEV